MRASYPWTCNGAGFTGNLDTTGVTKTTVTDYTGKEIYLEVLNPSTSTYKVLVYVNAGATPIAYVRPGTSWGRWLAGASSVTLKGSGGTANDVDYSIAW